MRARSRVPTYRFIERLSEVAQIVVRRVKAAWVDRGRDYRILVAGVERASVANGSSIEIPVEPGPHSVRMKVDWCNSKELLVTANADAPVLLECGPNATPILAVLYTTLLRNSYMWLDHACVHKP